MKKEVIKVSQDKDFLDSIEEIFGNSITKKWIYIDQSTINILAEKQSLCYMDTNGELHIAYGNIIVEAYSHYDYSWYSLKKLIQKK